MPHFCVDQVRFSVRFGKSRNLSKIVSVLLSASVERVGVSRMRDFLIYICLLYCNITVCIHYTVLTDPVMCLVSCVTCHITCVMCHLSQKRRKKGKFLKLVGEGSVIN